MNDFSFFSFLWTRYNPVFDNENVTAIAPVTIFILDEAGDFLTDELGNFLIYATVPAVNAGDLYRYD